MEAEKVTIDDIVVLGNAVPDEISDNRKTVCTVGYSFKMGLIRIYPVRPDIGMKRWEILEIPLERNPKDTRLESWKVQGSKSEWDGMRQKIGNVGKVSSRQRQIELEKEMKERYGVGCVEELNIKKRSLGFITPNINNYYFSKRSDHDSTTQKTLYNSEPFLTVKNYKVQPRLVYRCSECKTKKEHDQQILEWGAYEWIRKNPDKMENLWENLRLNDPNYEKTLLVGNQALHRNSFMVISIFRRKTLNQRGVVLS